MTTQKQVALELIGKHIAQYHELDIHQVYGDRLHRAKTLLEAGKVSRKKDGAYIVESASEAGKCYLVNGTCECDDFAHGNAPNGWCKHRLAAKTYQVVFDDLRIMQAAGVPHLHFVCEHGSRMELCWQRGCEESMEQLCAGCLANLDDVEQSGMSPAELSALANTWEAEAIQVVPTTTPAEELRALAQPVYEENPQSYTCAAPGKGKKAPAKPVTMPEAPASLNLKLKLPGGGEIMYTMRSMVPGAGGDTELAERLAVVLPCLEAVVMRAKTECQTRRSDDHGAF